MRTPIRVPGTGKWGSRVVDDPFWKGPVATGPFLFVRGARTADGMASRSPSGGSNAEAVVDDVGSVRRRRAVGAQAEVALQVAHAFVVGDAPLVAAAQHVGRHARHDRQQLRTRRAQLHLAEQVCHQRHAHRHTELRLPEVDRARVVVEVVVDLVDARQRVHHARVLRRRGPHRRTRQPRVVGGVLALVAFALGARHVDRVDAVDLDVGQLGEQRELVRLARRQVRGGVAAAGEARQVPHRRDRGLHTVVALQPLHDVVGQLEARVGHRHDVRPEPRQRVAERVDRARVAQVAAEHDLEAFEPALLLPQRVEVAERLRRVLVCAVAAVDHRHGRVARRDARGAVLGVANDEDVGVAAADDANGVRERLALRAAGRVAVGRADHAAAQTQHRRLEAQARARRRLEEQRRHDRTATQVGPGVQVGAEFVGVMEELEDLGSAQVLDGDEIALLGWGHRPVDHAGGAAR